MSRLKAKHWFLGGLWPGMLCMSMTAQCETLAGGVPNDLDDRKAVMQAQIEVMRKELDLNNTLKSLALSVYQPLPSVLSLSLLGQRSQARLLLPSGSSASYKVGDLVAAGARIVEINAQEVWVELHQKGKTVRVPLEFATGSHSATMPAAPLSATPNTIIPAELMPKLPSVPLPSVSAVQPQSLFKVTP